MKSSFNIRKQSEIYIGPAAEILAGVLPEGRIIAISDGTVDRLHHNLLSQFETILIGTGETIKTLATAETICRRLIETGADRSTFILGIGGGIISDIVGFIASTYMRGVPFGFISTTLLGQVDASVGGKNGVNVDGYKNMLGTFTQPRFVICDPEISRTLPDREFRAGLAEAIKAGIIGDATLFEQIHTTPYDILRSDIGLLTEVIRGAISVKAAIVEQDEYESNERRKLNLGHTLAHAIEKCSNKMNHGEAVAVGTALMAQAAVRLGVLSQVDCDKIGQALSALGFSLTSPVDMKRLLREISKDKKGCEGVLNVVFPTSIGSCTVRKMTQTEFAVLFE